MTRLVSLLLLLIACRSADAGEIVTGTASTVMPIGVYYYPDQWPETEWDRDIRRIAELGFAFIHVGELSWARMEPKEGEFDFEWLDRTIELARRNGLRVILCTPSAAPPAWLSAAHPETLVVDDTGTTIRHGSRQHGSWSSPVYRQYVQRIVEQLAKRYGHDTTVWGWQIDNEPSHYRVLYDYGPLAQQGFQRWLTDKYGDVAKLNAIWGAAFWSQTYADFAQIRIPNARELLDRANPHAVLDFRRFTSREAAAFIEAQSATLRQHIDARQWITSNFFGDPSVVDPREVRGLDLVTFTMYPVNGYNGGTGSDGFRIGSSLDLTFASDWLRSVTGKTGVMELQPGQINWGSVNAQPLPGAVRLWIFAALASGNQFVATYRYRQPLSGIEQYHNAIMQPDGVTVARSGSEFVAANAEIQRLSALLDRGAARPRSLAQRRAAILTSADNERELDYQPQSEFWNTQQHVRRYYRALQRMGAPVDVIAERARFEDYPVLIAPAYELLDPALIERWRKYAEAGGHLVLTCRTGQKNREAHLWKAKLAEPIRELIGTDELYFDTLPRDQTGHVRFGEREYTWRAWADVLQAKQASAWATYSDQFYHGAAAVLHRKIGRGSITYVGVDTLDGTLEEDILRRVYGEAKIPVASLPDGVIVSWRDGVWFGLNYSSTAQPTPAPTNAQFLLGGTTLPPAGVAVWR